MQITDFVKQVKKQEIDIVEHTHKVVEKAKKINKEYNYFNTISEKLAIELAENVKKNPKGMLAGVAVSVKDNICVKGVETTAGSKILKGYKPLFDATVIEKIKKEGGIIIGKTAQDEFGFGSFSVNVGLDFKVPKNPFDKKRACGGSSGGSAGITQIADFPHIALGQSTGGSISAPASYCNVFGLCPTYGRVSRYGLIDFANSLDKIGSIGKTAYETALLQEVISGHDSRDSTSLNKPVESYSSILNEKFKKISGELRNLQSEFLVSQKSKGFLRINKVSNFVNNKKTKLRVAVIKETFNQGVQKEVKDIVWNGIKKLESLGIKYEEISLPLVSKYGVQAYYLIAMSESSTNLAKFCGMRYGKHEKLEGSFNEYFTKTRNKNFGDEAKRRIILGTFARMAGYRDAYYIKAMKVRTKIIDEYKKAFKKIDLLISPTMPITAPKISEIEKLTPLQNYMIDIMTVGPNLAGLPHLNVPVGFNKKLPVGMLLTGDHFSEGKLLQLGDLVE